MVAANFFMYVSLLNLEHGKTQEDTHTWDADNGTGNVGNAGYIKRSAFFNGLEGLGS